MQDGDTVIVLLIGGDKSSQQKDIAKAHELADGWGTDQAAKENGDESD